MPGSSSNSIRVTKDGSNTLFSQEYDQTFHSIHGAVRESHHVFLDGSGLTERLQKGLPSRILEVGLGTGLNFLLTADLALKKQVQIDYWALEKDLIQGATLRTLQYETYLDQKNLLPAFAIWLDEFPTGSKEGTFHYRDYLTLHVIVGDASKMNLPGQRFHIVYQDAFSPDVNAELWTPLFFRNVYAIMEPGGCLSTYSARRLVRENLATAGFTVMKRPGPPGKREMVAAIKRTND